MRDRRVLYIAALLLLYLLTIDAFSRRPQDNDFAIFYSSARKHWEGESIYSPIEIERYLEWDESWGPPPDFFPNLNPPFFTLLVLPLSLFSFPVAFWIWSLASLAAGAGAALWLEAETRRAGLHSRRPLLFPILLLAYFPTWANIQFGQVSLFLFLLLVAAWSWARTGRDAPAGAVLGLALSLKIFVALFVLLFLILRRYRLLGSMVAVFAAGWLVSFAVFGTHILADYRATLKDITWSSASWNASFLGFFTRLLGGSENQPWIYRPVLAQSLASILSVLSALSLVVMAHRIRGRGRLFDLAYGFTLILILLISPLGWLYYFPLLLLPMTVIWTCSAPLDAGRAYRRTLLAAALLGCLPVRLIPAAELNTPLDWLFWSGVYFYSLLLLALLTLVVFRKMEAASPR